MIKCLLTALLLVASPIASEELAKIPYDPSRVTAFVQVSPVGSYYGNPIARALTERNEKGVYAIYLNGSEEFTSTGLDRRIENVAYKLNKLDPEIIVAEFGLSIVLEQYLKDNLKLALRTYQFADTQTQYATSYAAQLKLFFSRSNYNLHKIVILHDSSPRSMAKALISQSKLLTAGFSKGQVSLRLIKSFQGIRTFLSESSSWPRSLLINNITFLRDAELGQPRFGDEIKMELGRLNRWHIDVGFWKSRDNEAIIFVPDVDKLLDSLLYRKEPPLKSRMLINTKAFKELGLKHLYINGLDAVDGITDGT